MRYRRGEFEVRLVGIGRGRYKAEIKYRGSPLHLKRTVVEYIDGYKMAVNPYDDSIVVYISMSPPVAAKIGWRTSTVITSASEETLRVALDRIIEFVEAYMAAYRLNAMDKLFHED